MKLTKTMHKALNKRIMMEFHSAFVYLKMSVHFRQENLAGFAHWLEKQSIEELDHGMKFQNYVLSRDGTIEYEDIKAAKEKWSSHKAVFEAAYKQETIVTSGINELMNLAIKEQDHTTVNFLQWFVNEQMEEENSAQDIVAKLARIGNNYTGLMLLDKDLGVRDK